MKKEPVKVSLIEKENDNFYKIRFPNLHISVDVNDELYQKILCSGQYHFVKRNANVV